MFARWSLKQKRPNNFQSVVIWNNGHSRVSIMRWVENVPILKTYFYVLMFVYQLEYWVVLTLRLVFFYMLWFLGTAWKLAWSKIPGHLPNFTLIFPDSEAWWLMTFPFSTNMRLWFGLTRLCLMNQTSQTCVTTTCYSALVFNWAMFMIHANVRNAKLNVYWG